MTEYPVLRRWAKPCSGAAPSGLETTAPAPTVGIVIPARNAERTIDQTLASVASQHVRPDEVVVVDDGSTDGTRERVREWEDALPVTVVSSARSVGIGLARHRGITALGTDLIMQLDADDAILPQHIRLMMDAFRRRPGLISPRPIIWDGSDRMKIPAYVKDTYPRDGDQLAQLLVHCYVVIGSLYSRKAYMASGGYRPCRFAEDWDLWLRMVANNERVTKIREHTYMYRVHSSYSSTFNIRQAQTEPLERFLDDCNDFHYRRIAKLSILQRLGAAYLDRFPCREDPANIGGVLKELGIHPRGAVEVARDSDIGLIVHATSDGETVADDLWVIRESEDPALVLHMRLSEESAHPVYVENEDHRLKWSSLRELGLMEFGLAEALAE